MNRKANPGSKDSDPATTILVVEDDKGLNQLIQRNLNRAGFLTVGALNGSDAVARMVENRNILMLLDYILPDMNGKQLLEELKQRNIEVPFIIITGRGDEKVAVETMKLGACDYLVKEADFLELLPNVLTRVFGELEAGRKLAEAREQLRQSEKKFRQLIEGLNEGIWVIDQDANTAFVNPAMARMLGHTPDEMLGRHLFSFMGDEWIEKGRVYLEHRRAGVTEEHEFEFLHKEGARVYALLKTSPILDDDGSYIGALAGVSDITERKQAEEKLRETRDFVENLLDHANAPVIVWDPSFRITRFNHAFEHLTGRSADDALGKPLDMLFPGASCEESLAEIRWAMTGEPLESVEIPIQCIDGAVRIVLWNSATLYAADGVTPIATIAQGQDITERKRAEKALRESEERYRIVFERAGDYVLLLEPSQDGIPIIIDANEAALLMHGYSRDELVGKPITLLDTEMTPEMLLERKQLIETKGGGVINACHIRKDGTILEVEADLKIVQIGAKGVLLSIERDITERKRTEEALRTSERRYRTLAENLPQKIFLKDGNSVYVTCNTNYAQDLQTKPEEVTGKTDYDFFPKELAEKYRADDRRVMEAGKMEELDEEHIHEGKKVWVHTVKTPVFDESRNVAGILGIFWDITEHKLLEAQLRQAIKMEAIGRLAGGVAHDFNNLLTVIHGHAELMITTLEPRDPMQNDITEIQRAASRASDLTRQLLAFSRRQTLEPRIINLNDILTDLDKMLRRVIGEDISLVTIPREDLWTVKADPGQIEQVIINLAVNARDAMPERGKLTVETQNVELDAEYVRTHAEALPGQYVMLAISDTGCGMTTEVMSKIFEPFFTTKGEGKGTGLGLPTVYGIVKQSGGHISVYSEPGKGSTFKVYLPMVTGEAEAVVRKAEAPEMPCGTETILLVEDDEAVRHLAARILKKQGYKILEAESGGDAYLTCQKLKKPFDLLITDVVMPGMSGAELVQQIKGKWRGIKVLYMSGYTANAVVHSEILTTGTPYLQKPFRPLDLALKVRQVLDGDHKQQTIIPAP